MQMQRLKAIQEEAIFMQEQQQKELENLKAELQRKADLKGEQVRYFSAYSSRRRSSNPHKRKCSARLASRASRNSLLKYSLVRKYLTLRTKLSDEP
jgi:hypothetical protein